MVKLSGLLFIIAFVVAGLNWRFGWWVLPDWAVWVQLYNKILIRKAILTLRVFTHEHLCRGIFLAVGLNECLEEGIHRAPIILSYCCLTAVGFLNETIHRDESTHWLAATALK